MRHSSPIRRLRIARIEPILVAAAVPLLLFPRSSLPLVGLGLLFLGWALQSLATRKWLTGTAVDHPLLATFLMTLVGVYQSSDLALSMPKFYGIILGLVVCRATVSNIFSQRQFWIGAGVLIASIVPISLVGLIGTEWNAVKYPLLNQVYSSIPRLIRGVQTSVGPTMGFHPNELAGTLAFLLPLPISLVLRASLPRVQRVILAGIVLVGLGVLLLTASRSALISLAVAVVGLLIWRWWRVGLIALVIAALAIGIALSVDASGVEDFILKIDATSTTPSERSFAFRLDVWNRAILMIEDFPFTGIGLNTFPIVIDARYPAVLGVHYLWIPHAHNIYLQVAVDLGLGGLMAFLGLWLCTALAGWRAFRQVGTSEGARSPLQAAIVGLLMGLLAYLTFGLTDAITLGAKPTVLLWLIVGLVIATQRLGQAPKVSQSSSAVISVVWHVYWIITYLLVGLGYLVSLASELTAF